MAAGSSEVAYLNRFSEQLDGRVQNGRIGKNKLKNTFMATKRAIIQSIIDGAGKKWNLPPRKKRIYKNNLIMRFIIPGILPSKKNCQIPSINRNRQKKILQNNLGKPVTQDIIEQILAIKPYIRSSERYKKWEEPVCQDLVLQAARWHKTYENKALSFPITKATITIYHYWKDDAARDNSNKAESIHDTLVKIGVIADDRWQVLYKHTAEADNYSGEILEHLTVFTITAHEW